jgi:hypothetical protein
LDHYTYCFVSDLYVPLRLARQTMYCRYKRNIEATACNHIRNGRTINITYFECMSVALGIQHACPILSFVVCSTLQYFSTLFHKRLGIKKMGMNIKMCVQFSLETFLILIGFERDTIRIVYWSSCKLPTIYVRFSWNLNLLDRFSKYTQISIFMKIHSVGTTLFHASTCNGLNSITKFLLQKLIFWPKT